MAAARKTPAKRATPPAKKTTPDQTPEEALVAKAEVEKHEGVETEQTPEEAEATAVVAETFEAVAPQDDPKDVVEAVPDTSTTKVKILRTGLYVDGSVRREGDVVKVPSYVANLSDKEQEASYGQVFYKKM